jgi:rhodanese-related sulfurtransferase
LLVYKFSEGETYMSSTIIESSLFFFTLPTFSFFSYSKPLDYPNAVTPQAVQGWISAGSAILIDVREKSEVALGMASPAEWYPKSSIDSDPQAFINYLSPFADKKIVLYCRSGQCASIVIQLLSTKDIEAFNMGGFDDWVAAGLPTKIPQF